jgi:hypothetical protein
MPKAPTIETLLAGGSAEWNRMRKVGTAPTDGTGATFSQLFSANADLSGVTLVGSEWERCDLSKVSFRDADLSNAYFHGGRLQDCDFRGARVDGATFEKLKLLRCDFTGAIGLEDLELDEVDMDRVIGMDGEEAPPPPPPPAQGVTSFTREQRAEVLGISSNSEEPSNELPPFRPQDPPSALLFRGLKRLPQPPPWVLDVPGLRPPTPQRLAAGTSLESFFRDAVKTRLEGRPLLADQTAVARAQQSLKMGAQDAALASSYLREVNVAPLWRFSAAQVLKDLLRADVEVEDLTGQIDPRVTGALLELRLPVDVVEHLGEARRRLAAVQLFSALLEAGFAPDNNWEEAVDSIDVSQELAHLAGNGDREALQESFLTYISLPDEVRLRRLAYIAEAVAHLEVLSRLPEGVEPQWISGPEYRECDEREMTMVQTLTANDIPNKVPALAQAELGIPEGTVPEDSETDLFVHLRCDVCGKEKLLMQSHDVD